MVAVLTGVALATLDTDLANTAPPTIGSDHGSNPSSAVWISMAYQLAVVNLLLPLAALGEIVGQDRIFVAGLALFPTASAAFALVWSLPTLVAARVLPGMGASAITAVNVGGRRVVGRGRPSAPASDACSIDEVRDLGRCRSGSVR